MRGNRFSGEGAQCPIKSGTSKRFLCPIAYDEKIKSRLRVRRCREYRLSGGDT